MVKKRVLINCSNLHVGGGVQVASSFIFDPQINVLHNSSGGISVQTILAFFTDGTISQVIPTAIRESITESLDSLLNVFINEKTK